MLICYKNMQMTDQRQNIQSQNKTDNLTSYFNLFKATFDFCYNIKKFKAVETVWSVTRTMLRNIYPFQLQRYLVTWSLIAFLASTKFDFISYRSFMSTEELKLAVILFPGWLALWWINTLFFDFAFTQVLWSCDP